MSLRAALTGARLSRSRNPQQPLISQRRFQNQNSRNNNVLLGSCDLHSFALRRDDDREERRQEGLPRLPLSLPVSSSTQVTTRAIRSFHSSPPTERAVAIILGLTTVSALGYAGASAVQSWNEWQASRPSPEELEEERKKEEAENAKAEAKNQEQEAQQEPKTAKKEEAGPRKNIFKEWFGVGEGSYYEGGFDDKMTKKEAALILGVRESSSAQRIKDAHRKLLILNHPDTGGSTYLSGKINEAKELLLKGKRGA